MQVLVSEGAFFTYEQAYNLFDLNEAIGSDNTIFVAIKDTNKEGISSGISAGVGMGIIGEVAGNLVDRAMEARNALGSMAYDALLINETSEGFGIIPIVYKGFALSANLKKMTAKPNRYFFIPREVIMDVKIKNYSILSKSVKKFSIQLYDKTKVDVLLRMKEKDIPYQAGAVAKLIQKYGK